MNAETKSIILCTKTGCRPYSSYTNKFV